MPIRVRKTQSPINKKSPVNDGTPRGPERIRTAVRAFAELCLAARPQDHMVKLGIIDTADNIHPFNNPYPYLFTSPLQNRQHQLCQL